MTIYIIQNEQELVHILEDLHRRGYTWRGGEALAPASTLMMMVDIREQNYQVYLHEIPERQYVLYGPADRAWTYAEELPYTEEVIDVGKKREQNVVHW